MVHFGAQFTAGKPKILQKTKISAKTTSLGISNNVSPRSQKNNRVLAKLNKKNWGPKLGLHCPIWQCQGVIRNSHIAYNSTYHLYFLDVKFQLLSISVLNFIQQKQLFFVSWSYWVNFDCFRAIIPLNNVRMSWHFDHEESS